MVMRATKALYDRAFEVTCQLGDLISTKSESDYSGLILTVGGEELILSDSVSCNIRDGPSVARRMGFEFDSLDGLDFSIYNEDVAERLISLTERVGGRKEMDGALVVAGDGRILLKDGMRLLTTDIMALRKKKPLESGTGRNYLAAATLLSGVRGYIKQEDEPFSVREYGSGWCLREYNPKRRNLDVYVVIPASEASDDGKERRVKSYDLSLESGDMRIYGPGGDIIRTIKKRSPSVLSTA